MKQRKLIWLTIIVIVFAVAALTQSNVPASHNKEPEPALKTVSEARGRLASAAVKRWQMGGQTHWRTMLLQR